LQPLQSVQAIHAIPADAPAFAPEQDVNALIAESGPALREFTNPLADCALIPEDAFAVPGGATQQRKPARALRAQLKSLTYPACDLAAPRRLQIFFLTTS
jgi:hypothetical protein